MKNYVYLIIFSLLSFPVFSAEEDESYGIEEVIVTAEKREASIQAFNE